MARLAFLFLVVIGALAVLVAAFVGMGLYQAARLQEPAVVPPAAVATRPAATVPATRAGPRAVEPTPQVVVPVPVRPPPLPPPPVIVDQPLVLLVRDATLIGDDLRLDPAAPPTVTDWTNRRDGLEWTAQVPVAGIYDVEIIYACDKNQGGGVFTLRAGQGGISTSVRATAGWEDYQSQYIGKLYLSKGPTALNIRPIYLLPGDRLMNLRSVTLKFVKQIDEPAPFRSPFSRRRGF